MKTLNELVKKWDNKTLNRAIIDDQNSVNDLVRELRSTDQEHPTLLQEIESIYNRLNKVKNRLNILLAERNNR
tara:strand:+ start:216 stop:434 length:219 start_codon:yes stop_codon:yes gene_type:complete